MDLTARMPVAMRRYVQSLMAYKYYFLGYLIVSLWIVLELRIIGLWMVGSITQTLLALVTIHLWMNILDMETLSMQAKKVCCESCTEWFRVEHFLSVVQVGVLVFLAPHWPLTVLVGAGVAWDSVDFFLRSLEGRVLDPTTIWKLHKSYGNLCLVKMVCHALLFVLFLAYIGPWTIVHTDSHYSANSTD